MRLTHFEYTSGSNPYIVFTPENAERIIKRWRSRNVEVKAVGENAYLIDDKEYEKRHGNYWSMDE